MAKKESSFKNMVITLFLVTFLASSALAIVYNFTKEPIEASKLARKLEAIKEVVPEFNNNPYKEAFSVFMDGDSLVLYPAKKNEEMVGTAIETFTKIGFGGLIKIMVGFLPDGEIYNSTVMEHKETPGLGDKMQKEKSGFSNQINNKNPKNYILKVKKDGGDVDAITAATISSRAFCDAVQRAYSVFKESCAPTDTITNYTK